MSEFDDNDHSGVIIYCSTVVLLIFLVIVIAGILNTMQQEEIVEPEYKFVEKLTKDNPRLKALTLEAMKDGKISYAELSTIRVEADKEPIIATKTKLLNSLKEPHQVEQD